MKVLFLALLHIFTRLLPFFSLSVCCVWRKVSHLFPQLPEPQLVAVGSSECEVPGIKPLQPEMPQRKYVLAGFFKGIWITVSSPATLHLSSDYKPEQTYNLHRVLSQQILYWMLHRNVFWRSLISPKLLPKRLQSTPTLPQLTAEKIVTEELNVG